MQSDLVRMALILGLLSCVGPFAIDMYLPALPAIADSLGAPVEATQYTLMSFFVAFGICQLFYGPASDMFGRKPPLYFGLVLFAVASVGCALAPTIEWLIALRFVQGIGAASVMSIPRAVIRDRYTGTQATRLMTTVMLVISISPMLAPLAGSALIGPLGWPSVFIAVALATVVSLILAATGLPETLQPANRVPFRFSAMTSAFGTLLRDPGFMGLTIIGGFGMSSFFVFLSTASFLYTGYYGLTPTQFSLAFALNALGFFASSQFAANLGERFGAVAVVRWAVTGFAVSASLMLAVIAAGFAEFAVLVAMLLLCNVFLGLVIPTSMVLSLEEHGPIAGTAAALGGALQMLLGAVAIVIVSLVFDGTPLPLVAAIATCALAALAISALTLRSAQPVAVQP
ncbi:MFS transporter, DHA1 family, bicyclomycin/chloramphenicol resistance protein [Microbulbifer donghaiensis]|uniref:Bcr/CflA family efflux transporter n=1 Tax=Microbulbifer donghaiensis TaxID=494016 RepID=A0A1M5C7Y9_9GAMM|nr:multidrug effflux MFS transporter [Microbulbifer donghaiensis]SHF50868.1 MFS transporter, DHA1 family, bicyclomycin/chloramphenicol resistance protein [Microbulbifer donghaiensis]